MSNCPIISVIVPVYNAELYLSEAINSCLNQTVRDFEIIAINDGSNDRSLEILEAFAKNDNRMKVYTQENSGVSKTRKRAVELAAGEFIVFLDADDYYDVDAFECMINLSQSTNADLVIGEFNRVTNHENILYHKLRSEYTHVNILQDFFQEKLDFGLWGKLYKSHLLKSKLDIMDVGLKQNEDYYILLNVIFSAQKIVGLDKEIYNYRYVPNSGSRQVGYKSIEDRLFVTSETEKLLIEFGLFDTLKENYLQWMALRLAKATFAYDRCYELPEFLVQYEKSAKYHRLLNWEEKLRLYFMVNNHRVFYKIVKLRLMFRILYKMKRIPKRVLRFLKNKNRQNRSKK